MRVLPLAAAILALAACHQSTQPTSSNEAAPDASAGIKGVHRDFRGRPEPAASFDDPGGKPVTLAAFKGKPLLVNLWAAWCAPCVKELPTLDQLAKANKIRVLAVSEDKAPQASVVAFLNEHKIGTLKPYRDPNTSLSAALGPDTIMPTSILIDANGKEVWRYVGDLDWTSPEAARLLSEAAAAPKKG